MAKQYETSSQEDSDPTLAAVHVQQRIIELKRRREQRIGKVVTKANAALDDIVARVQEQGKEDEEQMKLKRGKTLAGIEQLMLQRHALETQMTAVVVEMHASISEVEEMMMSGYEGREEDMEDICDGKNSEKYISQAQQGRDAQCP